MASTSQYIQATGQRFTCCHALFSSGPFCVYHREVGMSDFNREWLGRCVDCGKPIKPAVIRCPGCAGKKAAADSLQIVREKLGKQETE